MTDFLWVASYPKSGCTWMRFIIAHLLFDVDESKSLIRAMVPNMHDWEGPLDYSWQGAHPVKTHLAYQNLPSRMHSRRAIYIMRNPLDMIDSAINYMCQNNAAMRDKFIDEFSRNGTIEPWGNTLGYSSWEENVMSWTKEDLGFPVLALKYEDMLEDTHSNIKKVADFLLIEINDEKIEKIVNETAFSNMKKIEEKELTSGVEGVFSDERLFDKENYRFMRSGKSGRHIENFSEPELSSLLKHFESGMKALGYI